MATLIRVKARWSGFVGGPGYSIFHMRDFSAGEPTNTDASNAVTRIRTFFDAIKAYLPQVVTVQVESDVEVLEETTGELQTILSATPVSAVVGTALGSETFATAVGAVVTWRTAGVRNGRRIRGRTFLVPLSNSAFANDGTLGTTFLGVLNTAAAALQSATGSPDLGVWARPSGPAATDGIWYAANGYSIPDMGAVLRSRRD